MDQESQHSSTSPIDCFITVGIPNEVTHFKNILSQ
jgi:hypothetical protein